MLQLAKLGRQSNEPAVNACLVGAAPDTSNLGVTALGVSTLMGIARRDPRANITVFDNGRGVRPASLRFGDNTFKYQLCGAQNTRRYYRRESYWNMRVSGWFGHLGNTAAKALLHADAILDVSGGDSFCDMYSPKAFRANIFLKRMALSHNLPLILLPQTYGPFTHPKRKRIAEEIVKRAALAWARDARSFDVLCSLLGKDFDPERHLRGVDLAFGLPQRRPELSNGLADCLQTDPRPIGINVSGLIYNDPIGAMSHYGLKANYRQIIQRLLSRLLHETDRRIILVPHVLCPAGNVESDPAACVDAFDTVSDTQRARITIVPSHYDPCEMKWIIAQTEWFCATRMHAGIAALSSGIPAAAVAYSIKTLGVFDTCRLGNCVSDPRSLTTDEVVEQLLNSWRERGQASSILQDALPVVFAAAARQMDKLCESLKGLCLH